MVALDSTLVIGNGNAAVRTSQAISLPLRTSLERSVFAFEAAVSVEKMAVYLQFNLDPDSTVVHGWEDYRPTGLQLRQNNTGALLAQTDGTFTTTVAGIINGTQTYLLEFMPFTARWRLAFQPQSASTNITVNNILAA